MKIWRYTFFETVSTTHELWLPLPGACVYLMSNSEWMIINGSKGHESKRGLINGPSMVGASETA